MTDSLRFLMTVLVLLGSLSCGLARAADEPAWYARPYAYVLIEQDVRGALEEFGRNLDLVVVMSDKVRGKARNHVRARTAGEFLDLVTDANGLTWFFDGNVLSISTDEETATRLFKTRGVGREQLQAYLDDLDVFGEHLSTHAGPVDDELFVSGPPAYLALIQQHLDLQRPASVPVVARERGVRVFRGNTVSTE
ncbi:type III secretion protein [Pseudomonas gingeri]|uniref:type III secretion protein n=1 Tax=Pseudomonas gingeri TaxID=117681 RepID=UPI003F75460A